MVLINLIGSIPVFIIDWIYCIFVRISSSCPNDQQKFILPVYICPKCGEKHKKLRPSSKGILKKKCLCGEKLPTTFMNGRQKLRACCPFCDTDLDGGGFHSEVIIPVIGGASSGKTCLINQAIFKLETETAFNHLLNFEETETPSQEYITNSRTITRCINPYKTGESRFIYYQFYLSHKLRLSRNLVSICDVAGEIFSDEKTLSEQMAFNTADTYVFVIDPLSIKRFREFIAIDHDVNGYKPCAKPIDEIMSLAITTINSMNNVTAKPLNKINLAVVFSKCDMPYMSEYIGEIATKKYQHINGKSKEDITSELGRLFLHTFDESNFVNMVETAFGEVKYFAVSAMGHNENDYPFVSSHVEDPFVWAIQNTVNLFN